MNAEERFVRDATRGLRGRARSDAQTELRSHLHERQQQLMQQGTPETGARAQALGELGSARVIAHGLVRQHGIHPGITASALCSLGVMIVVTGLATLYNTSSDGQLSALTQLLSRSTGRVNPCEGRTRCLSIYSQDELTDTDRWGYGLVPVRQAAAVFTGTDARVRGLLRKTVTLSGLPSLSLNAFLTDVGRDGHAGLQHGYLNLPELLLDASQRGWPVRTNGIGDSLGVSVQGSTLHADAARLACASMAEYLQQQMDRHLTSTVRQVADAAADAAGAERTPVQAFAISIPRVIRATPALTVAVPGRSENYALVYSRTTVTDGSMTTLASLNAFQIMPDEHGQLHVPVFRGGNAWRETFQIVASQAHFLAQVKASRHVAMLVKVPRDLKMGDGFSVVPVQEQNLQVQ